MSWELRLHCNECHTNLGQVENVHSLGNAREPEAYTLENVRNIMREHEVQNHGGKA